MNDILLSNYFFFTTTKMRHYHYTDSRNFPNPHYLAQLIKGHAKLVSRDTVVELSEGDVFYIPMDYPYESFWYGEIIEWHSYCFTYFPEGENTHFKMQKIPCDETLKKLVLDIPVAVDISSGVLGLFFKALDRLIPLMEPTHRGKKEILFENAINRMKESPHLTIPEIAKQCFVSDSTLYAAFKTVAGKTPNQIRNEILTEQAIRLLTTTDKSIQEISNTLNFSSTSYFRKILFTNTGKTPSQIRNTATRA